MEWRIRK